MANPVLPSVGTQIRTDFGDDAPRSIRHRHDNTPVSLWTIARYEGDVMHLEGQAIDCELNTVMNAITRYRPVTHQITLEDSHREALAAYVQG